MVYSRSLYHFYKNKILKLLTDYFFTDEINECLDSKAFIAHVAPVSDKLDLFTKLSNALHFPDYFGRNWDALIDLYYDFHWILEKDIVIFHESLSGLSEQDLKTYLQIVFIALNVWSDEKVHRISFVFSCQDEDKILRIIFDNTSATFKL